MSELNLRNVRTVKTIPGRRPRRRLSKTKTFTISTMAAAAALLTGSLVPALALDGIDVSSHQHPGDASVDWNAVASSGQKFAFIKATEGVGYTNPYFLSDSQAAAAAGITIGSYHFARPGGDARAEAKYYAEALTSQPQPSLPPVLDLETNGGLGVSDLQNWVRDFVDEIKKQTGRTPIMYTYYSFWKVQMGNTSEFSDLPLWLAYYSDSLPSDIPGGWDHVTFWQHASDGRINGINSAVDLNVYYGDDAELNTLATGQKTTVDVAAPTDSAASTTLDLPPASATATPALRANPQAVAEANKAALSAGNPGTRGVVTSMQPLVSEQMMASSTSSAAAATAVNSSPVPTGSALENLNVTLPTEVGNAVVKVAEGTGSLSDVWTAASNAGVGAPLTDELVTELENHSATLAIPAAMVKAVQAAGDTVTFGDLLGVLTADTSNSSAASAALEKVGKALGVSDPTDLEAVKAAAHKAVTDGTVTDASQVASSVSDPAALEAAVAALTGSSSK